MHWTEKEYALYIGDENVCDGTIPEIAARTGREIISIKWHTTPTGIKRSEQNDFRTTPRLVPIVDETRALMTYRLSDEAIDALSEFDIFTVGDLMRVSDEQISSLRVIERVQKQIAKYRDWFIKVEREDECDEAM